MGTTQTALEQNAATAVVFVLAIEGHGVLYCSDQSLTAAVLTSWTAYDWTVCRGGLEIPGEVTSKFVPFGKDASISPEPLSFRILDPLLAETMFATELATGELSRLKFDSQPDDTTIEAKDVSGFAASGNAFLGIEQFSYGSKTGADTLNVNDRGIYSPFAGNVDPILWGRRHQATILADANVAARVVSFAYEPPRESLPTRMATWGSGRSVPANEVMEFFWAVGLHKDDLGTTIEHHQQGSLPDIYFPTNEMRLIIFVGERQVGDQLSNITYGWDEWDV